MEHHINTSFLIISELTEILNIRVNGEQDTTLRESREKKHEQEDERV